MLDVNQEDRQVAFRLLDFFRSEAPWQRRLWAVGTVLCLKEVLEGSEAVQSGVLTDASFRDLCQHTEIAAGQDPGVGDKEQRRVLQNCLKSLPRARGFEWLMIRQIVSEIKSCYLERWSRTLSRPDPRPKPERIARAIASHLLDEGFSQSYLHKWWTFRIVHQPGNRTLADLVGEAHLLAQRATAEFEILVPFTKAPDSGKGMPRTWRTATEVSEWLRQNGHRPKELRQVGGFLQTISARDVYAALDHAAEQVERLSARVDLGTRSRLQLLGQQVWVKGHTEALPLRRLGRGVEIGALARERQLYSESTTSSIDAALELLGPLKEGPPGPAVAGGWAAIEALLIGPGDGGNRAVAGDRLAALVACSFPRAELTTLAYLHSSTAQDSLALKLRAASSNRDRAEILAEAIARGDPLALVSDSDRLAELRMKMLLAAPRAVLSDIEKHVGITLRRMYRQRNLVLHWGRMDAVGLRAALRTAAPLIGAGVDRIAHAWFQKRTTPLELSARAAIHLAWLESSSEVSPVKLLEPE